MRPTLSIAIPTYNRKHLVDFSLSRHLSELQDLGFPFEIVVSDNCSTDGTFELLNDKYKDNPSVKLVRLKENQHVNFNFINAFMHCKGEFVLYLADDDALIVDTLRQYVQALLNDPAISGIYADWIAYDDEEGKEMHRYYYLDRNLRFEPAQGVELTNFVFSKFILPESGIYRRNQLLKGLTNPIRIYPALTWMYNLSKTGSIVFASTPFYKENRVLKKSLARTGHWLNMSWALGMIGDEMRDALENLAFMNMIDAGIGSFTPEQLSQLRLNIDRWLHSRLSLEITRAIQRKEWVLALQLYRKFRLWNGQKAQSNQEEYANLVVPAAFQHIAELFLKTADTDAIHFLAVDDQFVSAFRQQYPEIQLLKASQLSEITNSNAFVVHDFRLISDATGRDFDRFHYYPIHLSSILESFRLSKSSI